MQLLATRRQFLETIGGVMGCAALGIARSEPAALAWLLGAKDEERLRFGKLDPLVDWLQATAPEQCLPVLAEKLRSGLALSDLVAATALANARALGGTNYNGYHALMALMPSYEMALQRSGALAALPVLKVVHRNVRFIREGAKERDALEPLAGKPATADLVERIGSGDLPAAELALARLTDGTEGSLVEAYERVQELVRQDVDVHRVVLSWRAYDLLRLAGAEHATTLLRQELRFCADAQRSREARGLGASEVAALVPALLESHELTNKDRGSRPADDARIERLAEECFASDGAGAAEAVARELAEGFDGADVGRALALTTARIVMHDRGQPQDIANKPAGSVHGANHGVHSSDALNAWRHIAELGSARHSHATWIAAAYHTGGHRPALWEEPFDHAAAPCEESDGPRLLERIAAAFRSRDQAGACAAVRRYTTLGRADEPLFELLLEAMVEQDGLLHSEKYFRTAQEEHANARDAHRQAHLLALTRVAASGYGFPAPGLEEARELLAG